MPARALKEGSIGSTAVASVAVDGDERAAGIDVFAATSAGGANGEELDALESALFTVFLSDPVDNCLGDFCATLGDAFIVKLSL